MTLGLSSGFIRGELCPPLSKSISHRLMLCEYLAGAKPKLYDNSDDLSATFTALSNLRDGGTTDCRESGSTLRFLMPVCAALGFSQTFITRKGLSARPMSAIIDAISSHGCEMSVDNDSYTVSGKLQSGDYTLNCAESSQFASGLLFALPLCKGQSRLRLINAVSRPYIDMTVKIMRRFGICIESSQLFEGFDIRGGQSYTHASIIPERDWSAAAFFICAAIMNGDLLLHGLTLPSIQGDAAIYGLISSLGGDISYKNGDLRVKRSRLPAFSFDLTDAPDLAPCLAALACTCKGVSTLMGAARLRLKECDRAAAITVGINALGGRASIDSDTIYIEDVDLKGGECDSYGDHRIAMMCGILSLICKNDVYLSDHEAVGKSYRDFFKVLQGLKEKPSGNDNTMKER